MIKIGVTGNIGSGKTTICKMFESKFGIKVYYADDRSKELLRNRLIIGEVVNLFGTEIINIDGQIDRRILGGIVFSDGEKLKKLEKILHPAMEIDWKNWLELQEKEHYVIKEAAILFESGSYKDLDKIIVVHTDPITRKSRVIARDKSNSIEREKYQMSEEEKIKRSDFVIENNDKTKSLKQVVDIHNEIMKYDKHK